MHASASTYRNACTASDHMPNAAAIARCRTRIRLFRTSRSRRAFSAITQCQL